MRHLIKKCLDFPEKTIGRNNDIEVYSAEDSERIEESYQASFCHLREYVYYHEQVARNRNVKCAFGDVSEENVEHSIGYWRKGSLS